jgi:hypothetical protein
MYFTFLVVFYIILDTDLWELQYDVDLSLNDPLGPIDTVALGKTVSQTVINDAIIKGDLNI